MKPQESAASANLEATHDRAVALIWLAQVFVWARTIPSCPEAPRQSDGHPARECATQQESATQTTFRILWQSSTHLSVHGSLHCLWQSSTHLGMQQALLPARVAARQRAHWLKGLPSCLWLSSTQLGVHHSLLAARVVARQRIHWLKGLPSHPEAAWSHQKK